MQNSFKYVILLCILNTQLILASESFEEIIVFKSITTSNEASSSSKKARITGLKVDPASHMISIHSTYKDLFTTDQSQIYSLSEMAKKYPHSILINAGFSTETDFPIPRGGLLVKKTWLNPIDEKDMSMAWAFCTSGKTPSIVKANETKAFDYCVQTGPILIKDGIRSTFETSKKNHQRSAVCINEDHDLILIQSDAISLNDLSQTLLQDSFQCKDALSLRGAYQSALIYRHQGESKRLGEVNNTIPSVIKIEKR